MSMIVTKNFTLKQQCTLIPIAIFWNIGKFTPLASFKDGSDRAEADLRYQPFFRLSS
jgi:hypothetical protein